MTFRMILATFAMLVGIGTMSGLAMFELESVRGMESAFWWTSFLVFCALAGPSYLYYQMGFQDGKKGAYNSGVEDGKRIASGLIKDGRKDEQ